MKKIVLSSNPYRDKNFKYAQAAKNCLQEAGIQTRFCLPFEVDRGVEIPHSLHPGNLEKELAGADMLVCFGGDGTILHASKAATRMNVPVLGVNIGTVGFIAELEGSEISMLRQIALGEYELERRSMLDVSVLRGGSVVQQESCLNDVVVTKGTVARVIRLKVCCDGVQAMEFAGDGVIVATPTGSTAYSLSAGGPIVEPDANVVLISPICAHDIRSRCIVASDRRTVTIHIDHSGKRSAFLAVDGGRALRLSAGDVVQVTRSEFVTKMVRMKNRSFYDIVNCKFHNL